MTENNTAPKNENERQYVVVDQMLTMHSLLRDRMERRAFWLNTVLIGASLFLAVFSFIGDSQLRTLKLDPEMTRFFLGLAAVVVLLCSITEFRVDWRSVAGKHAEATLRLGTLKAMYRKSFNETGGNDANRNAALTIDYERTISTLPPIPDRWFNDLKSEHLFKRLLSEKINQHPTAPIWLLEIQLRFKGINQALRLKGE